MVSFDLDFFPRDDGRGDEYDQFDEVLERFVGDLLRHGNIVGDYAFLELRDRVQVRVLALAPDAFEETNMSQYARNDLERLRAISQSEPQFQRIEEVIELSTGCDCQTPSFRLLYSHWNRLISPVLCGDCWRVVPLYRLPLVDSGSSKEQGRLTSWLDKREDFEWIWLHSGAGEREAYRQLARPNSPFMKETRDLAASLGEKTGVPTFAFLKHFYKKWGKHCPLCERKWKWKGPQKLRFRCDHCRLMSEKSTDYPTPLSELHP